MKRLLHTLIIWVNQEIHTNIFEKKCIVFFVKLEKYLKNPDENNPHMQEQEYFNRIFA